MPCVATERSGLPLPRVAQRNQYFYLGETVLIEVPSAANFVVSTYVMVEMAEQGNEGLVYGLLTTTTNLGSPLGNAIGNALFGSFSPSLSDSANYIADAPAFRPRVGGNIRGHERAILPHGAGR